MRIKSLVRLLFPLLSLISLLACSTTTATPTPAVIETSAATPTLEAPTATGAAPNAGACSNSYYPVVNGATWNYTGSGGPNGDYSYTDTISEIRADGFTITTVIDNSVTTTQQWSCKPEGLTALQLPGFVTILAMQQSNATLQTSDIQGVTLPAAISPGDDWSYQLNLQGSIETDGIKADTDGNAVYNFTAADVESVNVPAGTFDAMKINGVLTFDSTASISGFSLPVKISLNTTSWWAPGVGMVKTQITGDMVGTAINNTLELQSYNIP
jgi:hypothetical protein